MKYTYLFILILLGSCISENKITETETKNFEQLAQSYQSKYMNGGDNSEDILSGMDENIQFSENGKTWTYSDLKKFCPHLPKKNVVETFNDQKLINPNVGYDFVSQLYLNKNGDTIRETVSRIWKKSNDTWKIIQMNNLLNKATE